MIPKEQVGLGGKIKGSLELSPKVLGCSHQSFVGCLQPWMGRDLSGTLLVQIHVSFPVGLLDFKISVHCLSDLNVSLSSKDFFLTLCELFWCSIYLRLLFYSSLVESEYGFLVSRTREKTPGMDVLSQGSKLCRVHILEKF